MSEKSQERPTVPPEGSRSKELPRDSAYEAPRITHIGSLREVRTGVTGPADGAPFKRKPS